MTNRKELLAKIKALLAKTVENGCTEAEAMSALSVARRLMDEHDVAQRELDFGDEQVTDETSIKPDWDRVRSRLLPYVAKFCHCVGWTTRGLSGAVTFCGLESETVFAHWLLDMLSDFVTREMENYAASLPTGRMTRIERASFVTGAVERIATRLHELTSAPTTGRDLVVARNALIDAFLAKNDIRLREGFTLNQTEGDAYGAGRDAGARAQFNRPLEEGAETRLLR